MIDYTASPAETYWYILNAHGNVIALADKNGDRIVNYQYDAWGNLVNQPEGILTGSGELLSEANPFRYSSYQLDPETGLYYLKARYYNPDLGRFLTRDPMLAVNSYSYALNNPVNRIDSDGYWPKWVLDTWNSIKGFFNIETSKSSNTETNTANLGLLTYKQVETLGYVESNYRGQVNKTVTSGKKEKGVAGMFEKASAINVNREIGAGTNDVGVYRKDVTDILTVQGQTGLVYQDGIGGTISAKTSILSARKAINVRLFGWQIEVGMSTDILSVGFEATYGYFPGEGFTAKTSYGAGLIGGGYVLRIRPPQL